MKKLFVACLFILFLMSTTYSIPNQISFQGVIKDSSDSLISGEVSLVFSIYAGVSGGEAIWTETQTVTVEGGIYSVELGTVKPIGEIFDGSTRYLGIKVGSDTEMTPRLPMVSVPYAYRAGTAESATAATDADTVDGFHASSTPEANKLLPLDNDASLNVWSTASPAGDFRSSAASGTGISVQGNGTGGRFYSYGTQARGVLATATGGDRAAAVEGAATATGEGENYGGFFSAYKNQGTGVYARINAPEGSVGKAVHGHIFYSDAGYAGYFQGGWGVRMVTRSDFPSGAGGVEEGTMFYHIGEKRLYVYTGNPTWEYIQSYP